MAKQEAFLSNEDLGDSLDSAEALLKKHNDFETSLAAQDVKFSLLDEFAKVRKLYKVMIKQIIMHFI